MVRTGQVVFDAAMMRYSRDRIPSVGCDQTNAKLSVWSSIEATTSVTEVVPERPW